MEEIKRLCDLQSARQVKIECEMAPFFHKVKVTVVKCCFKTDIFCKISCFPQKKERHTGLECHEIE